VHKHIKLQPEHIAVPRRRFAHLHVDIVGPLPNSAGNTHIFTAIDRTTRWPEAVPLSSTSTAHCAAALFSGWIQRFGLPAAITSDRGPEFTSALWSALCKLLNISHQPTTAYHPQSNGLVERFHRRLKDALRARAAGPDWYSHLPWVKLEQLGEKEQIFRLQKPSLVRSRSCLVSSSPMTSHRHQTSSEICRDYSQAGRYFPPHTTQHQHHSTYQRSSY
jgi:transposase InsO family protein